MVWWSGGLCVTKMLKFLFLLNNFCNVQRILLKFDMKVHVIKIQPRYDFELRMSKVKGHGSLNMRKWLTLVSS